MNLDTNVLLVILLFLVVLLAGIVFGVLFLTYKILNQNNAANANPPVAAQPPMEVPEKEKAVTPEVMCSFHPDREGVGICGICEQSCCDKCLKEWEGLYFCPEHFKTYAENEWVQITNYRTTPNQPELGHFIYKFKNDIWDKEEIPAFIVTHYKIDVENDEIESYILLHVREQDEEILKKRLFANKQ